MIKIDKLFVYPIRGIRSPEPVKEISLGAHGIKFDREVMLLDPSTGRNVSTENDKKMAVLVQRLAGSKVTVTTTAPERLSDLPKTLVLDLDVNQPVGPLFKGRKHEGHCYPQEVCDWFSAAIQRKVVVIHTSGDRRCVLNPERLL